MNKILFGSIFTKGIGAVIEIAIQILIIHFLNVDLYGTYGYYISMAEIGFWVFFSAFSKCNLFYCAKEGNSISEFRKKYYLRYAAPIFVVLLAAASFAGDKKLFFVLGILLFEIFVFDKSSLMLARSQYKESILGEYCIGRMVLLVSVVLLGLLGRLNIRTLLCAYGFQYFAVLCYFMLVSRKKERLQEEVQQKVDVKKVGVFQYGDVLTGVIAKAPVILQYLFVGAFEAGFVNLISLVRTLVSFVSGPTSKVFLPEFSRLYAKGDYKKISSLFRMVIRMQMMFLTAVGVCLIGFPSVILEIFSKDLLEYSNLLAGISACFLVGLSFGPCSGLMQMTNREKKDITIRSLSVVVMILTWILTRKSSMFVLIGIGVQILYENIVDYLYVSKILGAAPVRFLQYLWMWIPMLLLLAFIKGFHVSQSFVHLVIAAAMSVLLYGIWMLLDPEMRAGIRQYMEKRKRG